MVQADFTADELTILASLCDAYVKMPEDFFEEGGEIMKAVRKEAEKLNEKLDSLILNQRFKESNPDVYRKFKVGGDV